MSLLLGKKKTKKIVVFLCTGNTCRGPMAQGYMKHAMAERGMKNIEVKTAGVMTIAGLIPTPEAVQVMRNADIDITGHRSSPLTPELLRKAELVLGMTPFHVQYALRMSEDAKEKTFLLKEYAASDLKNYQITDPMGMTLEVYKRVYREMKLAIDKMLDSKEFFTGVSEEELKRKRRKPKAKPKSKAAPATKTPAKAASKTSSRTSSKPASKSTKSAKPKRTAASSSAKSSSGKAAPAKKRPAKTATRKSTTPTKASTK